MRDFKSKGRGGFGGGRNFGDRGPREMFKAPCDGCGGTAELPFRPTGDKPVYCNNCFAGKKESSGGDSYKPRFSNDRGDRGGDRGRSFSKPAAPVSDPRIDEMRRQMDMLSSKLDLLIRKFDEAPAAKQPTTPSTTPIVKASPAKTTKKPAEKTTKEVKKAPAKKVAAKKVTKKK